MSNLVGTYFNLGRHMDALAMGEQVLEFQRRVLPANHPAIGEGCAGRDVLHEVAIERGLDFLFDLNVQVMSCTTLHTRILR